MIEKGARWTQKHITTDMWHGMSEKMIWDEFKRGNNDALVFIYNKYFSTLFSYAIRFCPDRELVKDIIQDLFVYLYKTRKSINSTTSIKFYLFKCLKRRTIAELKKIKPLQVDIYPMSWEMSSESMFIHAEDEKTKTRLLQLAIEKLSPKQQEIIYYIYYQNFSYSEASAIMGFSQPKSARKLLYRALNTLKKEVGMYDIFLYIFVANLIHQSYFLK